MNAVEDKLRDALNVRAEQTTVETTRMWYATNRRIQARRTGRSSRLRWLVPVVGVGALTAGAAVAVPAWLGSPANHTAQLTPAATLSTPTPTPTPTPTMAPSWQYVFNDIPQSAIDVIERRESLDRIIPVDFVRASEGDWVLYAKYVPPFGDHNPNGTMEWSNHLVKDWVGSEVGSNAGVPTKDPYGGPVNKWLTSSHLLDYPHYGGDGLKSGAGLQFAAGQALPGVARVTGVDLQGREHEAKLVGKKQGWPTQQYFIVVEKSVKIKTYKAYDANGKLLGSVTSEDFWDWPDN